MLPGFLPGAIRLLLVLLDFLVRHDLAIDRDRNQIARLDVLASLIDRAEDIRRLLTDPFGTLPNRSDQITRIGTDCERLAVDGPLRLTVLGVTSDCGICRSYSGSLEVWEFDVSLIVTDESLIRCELWERFEKLTGHLCQDLTILAHFVKLRAGVSRLGRRSLCPPVLHFGRKILRDRGIRLRQMPGNVLVLANRQIALGDKRHDEIVRNLRSVLVLTGLDVKRMVGDFR